MSQYTRRRVLAGVGVAGVGAVAGCVDGIDADVDEEPSGTTLGSISIENLDSTTHTVDVIVQRDSEVEHWSTHELDGSEGTDIEPDWSAEPGAFQIITRLDRDELRRTSLSSFDRQDCINLTVIVGRDGGLSVLTETDATEC